MPNIFEAPLQRFQEEPDRLSWGIRFDSPRGDKSFFLLQIKDLAVHGLPFSYTSLTLRTGDYSYDVNRIRRDSGDEIISVNEISDLEHKSSRNTISLTALVMPGLIVSVIYDSSGYRTVSRETTSNHPAETQTPLFRLDQLPEALDVEATGRALISQFEERDFDRQPTLVPLEPKVPQAQIPAQS